MTPDKTTKGNESNDQGDTKADTNIAAPTHDRHSITKFKVNGKSASILFKSFENLFRIFPVGVLSKYRLIGDFNVLSTILRCNLLDALRTDIIIRKNPIVTQPPKPNE